MTGVEVGEALWIVIALKLVEIPCQIRDKCLLNRILKVLALSWSQGLFMPSLPIDRTHK